MDFGTILLQVGTATPVSPNAALAGDLTDGGIAAVFARTVTDLINRGWGWGKKDSHAPGVILIGCAFVCGVIGVVLMLVMKGVDILNPAAIATAIFQGCTQAGPLAIAGTEISKDAREPSKVDAPNQQASSPDQQAFRHDGADFPPIIDPVPTLPVAPEPEVVPTLPTGPEPPIRERIIAAAERYNGVPYVWGGEKPTGVDCSGYTRLVYKDVGLPIPDGIRTAEQQRQYCTPVAWNDVRKGDLIFFEHTYEPDEAPGPDGFVASHIGISLGAGTKRMWNAVNDRVQLTDISTDYWQDKLLSAGRHPGIADAPARMPPAHAGAILRGIDVSSHQSADLSAIIAQFRPEHVVVKLAQTIELPGLRAHAKAQIASVKAAGVSCGGYLWLYQSIDPGQQVDDALSLAAEANLVLPVLWIDVETYPNDNSCPTAEQVRAALDRCAERGVKGGVYTGKYIWQALGNPSFPGVPLWYAHYNDRPVIDTPQYGDMTPVGHQWTSSPLDQNVFLAEVCG
jgi:cell wall-associated NlpC family hydrolase/GH25 family lysozyme M1 (1,4-beta-N-acetylmuramidase)